MIGAPPFPISIRELNADTLTTALGAEVASFRAHQIGADRGMLGEIFLVRPTYRSAGAGPESVICKFAALREGALASAVRGGAHERELRCYDEFLRDSRVSSPEFFAAWYDPETAHFLLIQAVVEPDTAIDQVAGVSPELVSLVVRQAAMLHHDHWEDDRLDRLGWLPPIDDPRRITNLTTLATHGWQPLCDLLGDELTPAERALGPAFPAQLESSLRTLATLPSTLVHGDLRADNLLFGKDHQSVSLIDWQGAGIAPGSFDIAYLISHSLTVEDRRAYGDELIDEYLGALKAAGTEQSREEFMAGYAPALNFGLAVACALPLIGDPGEPRVHALAGAMARRSIEAINDLHH